MKFADRIIFFVIFVLLSLVTFGVYPVYFWVTRMQAQTVMMEEQTELLKKLVDKS
jgi:hypothetical protein